MSLENFRKLLSKHNITVYVLPRTDEHQSEYLGEGDQRVAFLSGFSGSNGLAIISQVEALVWTDSRYYLQIAKQLHKGWDWRKLERGETRWFQHIVSHYKPGDVVAIDARLMTAEAGIMRKKYLEEHGFKVLFMEENLVDEIWENRPKCQADIFVHEKWAGKTANEKIQWVQKNIAKKAGNGCLFADLSEICWILNVRSAEIPYNPFMKSVLLIAKQGQNNTLYLPAGHPCLTKVTEQVAEHLKSINTVIKPYPFVPLPSKLLCEKGNLNYHIYQSLEDPIEWGGIGDYRAPRDPKEQEGFRQCHIRDGVAMASFWGWRSKLESIGQYEAAMEIDKRRMQQQHNKGLSFDTISAGGGNAAIVHYTPKNNPDTQITRNMIHLLDSGGQYLDGTTDVTRTFHFGEPTPKEKEAYTRVLLGNLDVERLIWPIDTPISGGSIDVLARRRLWDAKMDYGHGTGHGVGYFEGVHQGPVGISLGVKTVFSPGMVVSNEPGYYEQGKFGIRIENLIMCVADGKFLKFQNLTLCPYDRNLIDMKLLSKDDIQFINKYHQRVWTTLSPLLPTEDKDGHEWLRKMTLPL